MPISVNHSPGFSTYGQAMYDSAKQEENYARMTQLMQFLQDARKNNQDSQFQGEGLRIQEKGVDNQDAASQRTNDLQQQSLAYDKERDTANRGLQMSSQQAQNELAYLQLQLSNPAAFAGPVDGQYYRSTGGLLYGKSPPSFIRY